MVPTEYKYPPNELFIKDLNKQKTPWRELNYTKTVKEDNFTDGKDILKCAIHRKKFSSKAQFLEDQEHDEAFIASLPCILSNIRSKTNALSHFSSFH